MNETAEKKPWILAVDPGSDKVGYCVVNYDCTRGEKGVVFLAEIHRIFKKFCQNNANPPQAVVMGNGTAAAVVCRLYNDLEFPVPLRFAEEKNTTYKARARYFSEHPPTGFWKIVPIGLQLPPCPIDDYAAWLIGERYLNDHNLVVKPSE